MVDYSIAKIKMHVAVAEKLFNIENYQVAILRWKCAISTQGGGGIWPGVYIVDTSIKRAISG